VLFFPASYAQVGMQIAEDAIVVIKGRVDGREESIRVIGSDISLPNLSEGPRGPIRITVEQGRVTPPVIERLREVLASHPGTTEVQLELGFGHRHVMRLPDHLRVQPSQALMGDLKALLGQGAVVG
jgi:DNA polymerase-3 subunit alpha